MGSENALFFTSTAAFLSIMVGLWRGPLVDFGPWSWPDWWRWQRTELACRRRFRCYSAPSPGRRGVELREQRA
jgi:hypothetical protein